MACMQPLLYADDALRPTLAAEVFCHCAVNPENRIAMRLADVLRPLVQLLSSVDHGSRVAAAGALMCARVSRCT